MNKLRVGVLGCGQISNIYLKNLTGLFSDRLEVVGVADVIRESAEQRAAEFGNLKVMSPDEMIEGRVCDVIVNLTPAPAHDVTNLRIVESGLHLYSEKPLALSMDVLNRIIEVGRSRGIRIAVAPDTLLGAGVRTCAEVVRSGRIGVPVGSLGFISVKRFDERYLNVFRGPWLDLAPYHVGAIISYLGPIASVAAISRPARPEGEGASLPASARTMENPALTGVVLEHRGGAISTLLASSETWAYVPTLVVHGSLGTLTATDPNQFGGAPKLQLSREAEEVVELLPDFRENSRGIGAWDLAGAIQEGRPAGLTNEAAQHATEVLLAAIESGKTGRRVAIESPG